MKLKRGAMTLAVIDYNIHYYVALVGVCTALSAALWWTQLPLVRLLATTGLGVCAWYLVASVVGSFWTYETDDLHGFGTGRHHAVPASARTGVVLHAGVDNASVVLKEQLHEVAFDVIDFHDDVVTTERSIRKGKRKAEVAEDTLNLPLGQSWPHDDNAVDVVFTVNSLHELRTGPERVAMLHEMKRVLKDGGRVTVLEQLNSVANWLAFGPAALHFWSARTWRKDFACAGFDIDHEVPLTPFLRAFVLAPRRSA